MHAFGGVSVCVCGPVYVREHLQTNDGLRDHNNAGIVIFSPLLPLTSCI